MATPSKADSLPIILDIREAADALDCTPDALRKRCCRAAVVGPDGVTSILGPGIVAFKFGAAKWRVSFDRKKAAAL